MSKYEDTPAAVAMILFTLGGIFYVFQLIFMTEAWLAENGIGSEAIGLARVLGFTWLGIVVVLIRTFISGPAGTSAFFMALVIAQIGIFLNLWHQELMGALEVSIMDDAIIVTVLTACCCSAGREFAPRPEQNKLKSANAQKENPAKAGFSFCTRWD